MPITDDDVAESDETLRVELSAPDGVNLGRPSVITLTIVDDDQQAQPDVPGTDADQDADDRCGAPSDGSSIWVLLPWLVLFGVLRWSRRRPGFRYRQSSNHSCRTVVA